jgi:hypothetical protein
VLRIRLEPDGQGTRLTLEHSGFSGLRGMMIAAMMGGGWKGIVGKGIPAVLDKIERGEALPDKPFPKH